MSSSNSMKDTRTKRLDNKISGIECFSHQCSNIAKQKQSLKRSAGAYSDYCVNCGSFQAKEKVKQIYLK